MIINTFCLLLQEFSDCIFFYRELYLIKQELSRSAVRLLISNQSVRNHAIPCRFSMKVTWTEAIQSAAKLYRRGSFFQLLCSPHFIFSHCNKIT